MLSHLDSNAKARFARALGRALGVAPLALAVLVVALAYRAAEFGRLQPLAKSKPAPPVDLAAIADDAWWHRDAACRSKHCYAGARMVKEPKGAVTAHALQAQAAAAALLGSGAPSSSVVSALDYTLLRIAAMQRAVVLDSVLGSSFPLESQLRAVEAEGAFADAAHLAKMGLLLTPAYMFSSALTVEVGSDHAARLSSAASALPLSQLARLRVLMARRAGWALSLEEAAAGLSLEGQQQQLDGSADGLSGGALYHQWEATSHVARWQGQRAVPAPPPHALWQATTACAAGLIPTPVFHDLPAFGAAFTATGAGSAALFAALQSGDRGRILSSLAVRKPASQAHPHVVTAFNVIIDPQGSVFSDAGSGAAGAPAYAAYSIHADPAFSGAAAEDAADLPSYSAFKPAQCKVQSLAVNRSVPLTDFNGLAALLPGSPLTSIPHVDEAVVIASQWSHNTLHLMLEAVTRLVPLLPLLSSRPHVRIHLNPGKLITPWDEVRQPLAGLLELLGLDASRLVVGHVRATVAHIPEGTPCVNPFLAPLLQTRDALRAAVGLAPVLLPPHAPPPVAPLATEASVASAPGLGATAVAYGAALSTCINSALAGGAVLPHVHGGFGEGPGSLLLAAGRSAGRSSSGGRDTAAAAALLLQGGMQEKGAPSLKEAAAAARAGSKGKAAKSPSPSPAPAAAAAAARHVPTVLIVTQADGACLFNVSGLASSLRGIAGADELRITVGVVPQTTVASSSSSSQPLFWDSYACDVHPFLSHRAADALGRGLAAAAPPGSTEGGGEDAPDAGAAAWGVGGAGRSGIAAEAADDDTTAAARAGLVPGGSEEDEAGAAAAARHGHEEGAAAVVVGGSEGEHNHAGVDGLATGVSLPPSLRVELVSLATPAAKVTAYGSADVILAPTGQEWGFALAAKPTAVLMEVFADPTSRLPVRGSFHGNPYRRTLGLSVPQWTASLGLEYRGVLGAPPPPPPGSDPFPSPPAIGIVLEPVVPDHALVLQVVRDVLGRLAA